MSKEKTNVKLAAGYGGYTRTGDLIHRMYVHNETGMPYALLRSRLKTRDYMFYLVERFSVGAGKYHKMIGTGDTIEHLLEFPAVAELMPNLTLILDVDKVDEVLKKGSLIWCNQGGGDGENRNIALCPAGNNAYWQEKYAIEKALDNTWAEYGMLDLPPNPWSQLSYCDRLRRILSRCRDTDRSEATDDDPISRWSILAAEAAITAYAPYIREESPSFLQKLCSQVEDAKARKAAAEEQERREREARRARGLTW